MLFCLLRALRVSVAMICFSMVSCRLHRVIKDGEILLRFATVCRWQLKANPPKSPFSKGDFLLVLMRVADQHLSGKNCWFQQNSTFTDAPEAVTGEGFYCQNIYLAAVNGPALTEPHLDMTGTEVGYTQQVEYLG